MAVRESTLDLDGGIFIDDMLQYVFRRCEIRRVPIIPNLHRNIFREIANYSFSPDIGEALLCRIRVLPPNIAEFVIEMSNRLHLQLPNPGAHLPNFLMYHRAESLNENDFIRDHRDWCRHILDYLVIIIHLCFHFEERNELLTVVDVVTVASHLLRFKLRLRTEEKMERLREYARSVLIEPQVLEVQIFYM